MTDQEIVDSVEEHTDEVLALLKADENTDVNGKWSFKKIVKFFNNKLARKWYIDREYISGDTVSYNGKLYVSKKCNVGQAPGTQLEFWDRKDVDIVPNSVGYSKMCVVRNGTIVSGRQWFNSVATSNVNDNSVMSFTFDRVTNNPNYIVIVTYVNKNTYEVFSWGINPRNKFSTGFDLWLYNNLNDDGTGNEYNNIPYEVNISIKEV